MALSKDRFKKQNALLDRLAAAPHPVIVSRSNYDFMNRFLHPRRLPAFVHRHGGPDGKS